MFLDQHICFNIQMCPNPIPTPKPHLTYNFSLKSEGNNTDVEAPNPGWKPELDKL